MLVDLLVNWSTLLKIQFNVALGKVAVMKLFGTLRDAVCNQAISFCHALPGGLAETKCAARDSKRVV